MKSELKTTQIFHGLKVAKKLEITKNCFELGFKIPPELKDQYIYRAGQYLSMAILHEGEIQVKDFSMVSSPNEEMMRFGIKFEKDLSASYSLFKNYNVGDEVQMSLPKGRFLLNSKPAEFRTILLFSTGIGITPILAHLKFLLNTEPRTRLFLFCGNRTKQDVPFFDELEQLRSRHSDRLEIYYFYSQEKNISPFLAGHLDGHKVELIINQILNLDETDEESTIWDSVDDVLICGKPEMIKSVANACLENGIMKKNIHFELFESYNEDIFPIEKEIPILKDIKVQIKYLGKTHQTVLKDNKHKLLQSLSTLGFPIPFSCKSGICGSCICQLEKGNVELIENEYLTKSEEDEGKILACMSFALSDDIILNFDQF